MIWLWDNWVLTPFKSLWHYLLAWNLSVPKNPNDLNRSLLQNLFLIQIYVSTDQ